MQVANDLRQLLQEKTKLFIRYEQATAAMEVCPAEELEQHVKDRQELAEEIDRVDARIRERAGNDSQSAAWLEVVAGRRAEPMPDGAEELLEQAHASFAAANRIRRMEPLVVERIKLEQERLMEKIKENNQGVGAQAAKFYGTTAGVSAGPFGKFGKA